MLILSCKVAYVHAELRHSTTIIDLRSQSSHPFLFMVCDVDSYSHGAAGTVITLSRDAEPHHVHLSCATQCGHVWTMSQLQHVIQGPVGV